LGREDFGVIGVFEAGLRREFMLPLTTFRSYDPDPFIALVAALEDTPARMLPPCRCSSSRPHAPWAESVFRAVTTHEGDDFFEDEPAIGKLGKQKVMQPLFAAAMRIVVTGEDEPEARARLTRLASALSSSRTRRQPPHDAR